MRDLKDEIQEELCEFCDIDGFCLEPKNKGCVYRYEHWCKKWIEKYDSNAINKAKWKVRFALHNPYKGEKP